jgi:hypothetical protein
MNPFFPAASELLSRLRRLLSKQGMSLQTERLVLEITEDHTFILVNSTDKKVRIDGRIELDPQSCMIVAGPGEHVYLQISQQLYDAPDLQTAFILCHNTLRGGKKRQHQVLDANRFEEVRR